MASIKKIGNKHRVQIRRAGHKPLTKTFDSSKAANDWAIETEAALIKGNNISIAGTVGVSVEQAVDRFIDEMNTASKSSNMIANLKLFKKAFKQKQLDKLIDQDIFDFIKARGKSPATGTVIFSNIKTLFRKASLMWKYKVPNITESARAMLKHEKLIGSANKRNRRPTDEELEKICEHFNQRKGKNSRNHKTKFADVINFCIYSAMRISEVCSLQWSDLNEKEKTILVRDRKHPTKKKGNNQIVPLLDSSLEIIKNQSRDGKYIFPVPSRTMTMAFYRANLELKIEDLHLHDLRHEGTSRLFEMGYQIHEVAMFTGHLSWTELKRYTQLKAKDIRRLEKPKLNPLEGYGLDEETLKEFKKFQAMMAMMKQTQAA